MHSFSIGKRGYVWGKSIFTHTLDKHRMGICWQYEYAVALNHPLKE